jgi:hypothetical protein
MNIETRIQWKGKVTIRDYEPGNTARPRPLTPSLQSTESKRLAPKAQQMRRNYGAMTVTHGTFRDAIGSLESLAIHLGKFWNSEIALKNSVDFCLTPIPAKRADRCNELCILSLGLPMAGIWMAGFKLGWLKPLAMAAMSMTVLGAHNFAGAQSTPDAKTGHVGGDAVTSDALPMSPAQVAARQAGLAASPSTTTMTGADIEALPASSRRWEEFVMDSPPDTAQSNGAPSPMTFTGSQADDMSVDGVSLRLSFGSTSTPASGSPSQSSSGRGLTEPSGMGQAWSNGRGPAVSEAAVSDVRMGAGEAFDGGSRAGTHTNVETRSGGNALHGQAFMFDRQHVLAAQNPSANWVQQTSPATYSTVPVFTSTPYTPPDREMRWGFGLGSRIPHKKIYWFAALDGYNRNYAGVSSVKLPDNFFAQPSNDQVQLLGAQLGTNNTNALASYSQMLKTLDGLLGPVARTARQYNGFARVDWRAGERYHFTVEGTGADWNAPGHGFSNVSENYGNHSFGSSRASQQWLFARWEAFITPNLLAMTQFSAGRSIQGVHPGTASAYEQTLNQSVWGQLPQIVVDSSNGFTIGNPARFGQGSYPDERFVRAQQSFDWIRGSLLVRAGASYSLNSDHTTLLRNQTGTYHYSSVANFISDALVFGTYGLSNALDKFNQHNCDQAGGPWRDSSGVLRGLGYLPCYSYYSQMMGPNSWGLSTDDWAGFATAQWQPGKLIVLSAGLRWDMEVLPPPLASLVNPDLPLAGRMPSLGNSWGPRLSMAVGNAERHLPVLRLGYGMYFGRVSNGPLMAALTQTGSAKGDLNFFMRPTDNLNAGGAPPFPYVLAGEPLTMVKPGTVEYAPGFRNPQIHQAVASVEESLPGHFVLNASVMMSLGRRLPISIDTNYDPKVNPQTITYAVVDGTGKGPIKASQITVPFYADWPSSSAQSGTQGRLNSNYQQITQISSRANSTYEAAMIRLVRNSRRGLTLNARYIYGHAMDWNPNESSSVTGSDVLDPADFRHEYGVSSLEARHTIFSSVIFETPWKAHHAAAYFANGWRISGVGSFHSGMPYTMRTSGSVPHVVNLSTRAVITGLGPGMNGSGGDNRVYGQGNNGIAYDIGRDTFRYPNAWKADVRLGKLIDLGKMRQLELLGETFNLFNHRNVTDIETIGYSVAPGGQNGSFPTLTYFTGLKTNSTEFGQPLNSNSSYYYRERQFQLGLRLHF